MGAYEGKPRVLDLCGGREVTRVYLFCISSTGAAVSVAAQFLYGIHAHSIALISDAAHNLSDALSLLLAWGAYILARREPTERYTYGFRSASILAALVNAAILLIATGAIVWEEPISGSPLNYPFNIGGLHVR